MLDLFDESEIKGVETRASQVVALYGIKAQSLDIWCKFKIAKYFLLLTKMGSGKGIKDWSSLCGTATFCCCCLLIAIALMTLGIAKIVMGAIHLHDCDIERMIPIFLIVSGCTPVLFGCLAKQGDEENPEKVTCAQVIGFIGLLFSIAWLIAGSVWVFPNWRKLQDNPCKPDDKSCMTCNTDLMTFAAAVTIIDWVFMGLFLVSFFCICFRACCKS